MAKAARSKPATRRKRRRRKKFEKLLKTFSEKIFALRANATRSW